MGDNESGVAKQSKPCISTSIPAAGVELELSLSTLFVSFCLRTLDLVAVFVMRFLPGFSNSQSPS
jgi:hypothetical protein